jgi:hypothetical protein
MPSIRTYRHLILSGWLLLLGNTFLFPLYPAVNYDPLNSMTELVLEHVVGLEDETPGDEHKDEGADPLKADLKYYPISFAATDFRSMTGHDMGKVIPRPLPNYLAPTFDLHAPPPETLI